MMKLIVLFSYPKVVAILRENIVMFLHNT